MIVEMHVAIPFQIVHNDIGRTERARRAPTALKLGNTYGGRRMILSASRRTDLPNYYSDWFLNRVKEGFLDVRNPFNAGQVSRIPLSPEVVDCIVFWTKNPGPMLGRLGELSAYDFYFQFTLTGYGADVEAGLPDKQRVLIPTFKQLAGELGFGQVVWRYDPIFISRRYTPEYHLKAFAKIAGELAGFTDLVVISFLDMYQKIRKNMERLEVESMGTEEMLWLAGNMAKTARDCGMAIESCAEAVDLSGAGVAHGSCIDIRRIERLTGCRIDCQKDGNQRGACGCAESVDVGSYNTCLNGCAYCYANVSRARILENSKAFEANSTVLGPPLKPEDVVRERAVRSFKVRQMSLFDENGPGR